MKKNIYCLGCKKDVNASLVDGNSIYPNIKDLKNKHFYKCDCGLYVGCHPGTITPLGNIPTKELRNARSHIHRIIGPLWKTGKYKRKEIYQKISDYMGKPYHTGNIKNIEEARKIYRFVKSLCDKQPYK